MGEIIKFIIDNFNRLQPFDYILILLVAFLLSFGVFFIFRWIYNTYIKAQLDLIELKEKTISSYKEKTERLENEMNSFEEKMREAEAQLKFYSSVVGSEEFSKERFVNLYRNSMELRGAIFSSRVAQSTSAMIDNIKSLLVVYTLANIEQKFTDAPKVMELLKQLDVLHREVAEGLEQIQDFDIMEPKDLFLPHPPMDPKVDRNIDSVQGKIEAINKQITYYLHKAFKSNEKQA